jgi:hydrogenase maturation protein HypF
MDYYKKIDPSGGLEVFERIRVEGQVQGVGFRPAVWRLAQACKLRGAVWNDAQGVEIHLGGEQSRIDLFCQRLLNESPPLAVIKSLHRSSVVRPPQELDFVIHHSRGGEIQTGVAPDAATCNACLEELHNPSNRRFRYPFINCTHCGPRLSLVERIPYDRINTSMRHFPLCAACLSEYEDPTDRRFHAQPNACSDCGPRVWMTDAQGDTIVPKVAGEDLLHEASRQLANGAILAIKGVGGFHLACDAGNHQAVMRLRQRKARYHKPFALMARDLSVIRNYCIVTEDETRWLLDHAAPIVLLSHVAGTDLSESVAPGQTTLGFMLPYSPLHHLLLADWDRPLVMTSGNRVEEPQCVENQEAVERLHTLADFFLLHNRPITHRVDDSVVRVMYGKARLVRRARGYAPAPLSLPEGFANAPQWLALGGELKNTFCLLRHGQAVLSQHIGDLEHLVAYQDFLKTIDSYSALFQHQPIGIAADQHPGYRATRYAKALAEDKGLSLYLVQHHHAHIASVLAENHWPRQGGKVIGIALDGLGFGDDGTLWGGEFLLADYFDYQRLGHFQALPLPGGIQAIRQPWRNSFSQLHHYFGWQNVVKQWGKLEAVAWLNQQPLSMLAGMIESGLNTPKSSSCGRLFDAVAAILGLCRETISYEGQAAMELEALAQPHSCSEKEAYLLQIRSVGHVLCLDASSLWKDLLADLLLSVDRGVIARRFHLGVVLSVCDMAIRWAREYGIDTIALSGGVFQNKLLFEQINSRLSAEGYRVLSHAQVPSNDGGISLGQAVIAAANT